MSRPAPRRVCPLKRILTSGKTKRHSPHRSNFARRAFQRSPLQPKWLIISQIVYSKTHFRRDKLFCRFKLDEHPKNHNEIRCVVGNLTKSMFLSQREIRYVEVLSAVALIRRCTAVGSEGGRFIAPKCLPRGVRDSPAARRAWVENTESRHFKYITNPGISITRFLLMDSPFVLLTWCKA